MIYSKEDILSKIEWEGGIDGITWFRPEEVPGDMQSLWQDALNAKCLLDSLMDEIMQELESPND